MIIQVPSVASMCLILAKTEKKKKNNNSTDCGFPVKLLLPVGMEAEMAGWARKKGRIKF